MWGDAPSELQKPTEKGNLQARHPLQFGLQTPIAKSARDLTAICHRRLDNGVNHEQHTRPSAAASADPSRDVRAQTGTSPEINLTYRRMST